MNSKPHRLSDRTAEKPMSISDNNKAPAALARVLRVNAIDARDGPASITRITEIVMSQI